MHVQSHSFLSRESKTSEPRFKRLIRINTPDKGGSKLSVHHNFPVANRSKGLDNSKQNLSYEHSLSKVRSACKLDENTIVSRYLNTIRKDFDDMNTVSRRELMSMKMKKRGIDFIKERNQVLQQKRQELEQIIQINSIKSAGIKSQYQDAKMQTKTLENIVNRMKKDEIFYKQYGNIKDEKLKQIIKIRKSREEDIIHEEQRTQKLIQLSNDCKNLYMRNKEIRERKYVDYVGKICDVQERDKFIQQRKQRTYELQSIELNDTLDEKNIHMKEIILAHKVADSLLKSKANSLIKKYADVQSAFHLVKVKAGISEPSLLTSKFFSYEEEAANILQFISTLENRITELLNTKQTLHVEHINLINENLLMSDFKQFKVSSKMLSQKQAITKQSDEKQLLTNKISNWVDKKLALFNQQDIAKNESIDSKFMTLCNLIKEGLKEYKHINFNDKKIQCMGLRVKKLVKEITPEQMSQRVKEIQQMNDSNLIEQEFIRTFRQDLKKNFMIKQRQKRESGAIGK